MIELLREELLKEKQIDTTIGTVIPTESKLQDYHSEMSVTIRSFPIAPARAHLRLQWKGTPLRQTVPLVVPVQLPPVHKLLPETQTYRSVLSVIASRCISAPGKEQKEGSIFLTKEKILPAQTTSISEIFPSISKILNALPLQMWLAGARRET